MLIPVLGFSQTESKGKLTKADSLDLVLDSLSNQLVDLTVQKDSLLEEKGNISFSFSEDNISVDSTSFPTNQESPIIWTGIPIKRPKLIVQNGDTIILMPLSYLRINNQLLGKLDQYRELSDSLFFNYNISLIVNREYRKAITMGNNALDIGNNMLFIQKRQTDIWKDKYDLEYDAHKKTKKKFGIIMGVGGVTLVLVAIIPPIVMVFK